MISTEEIVKQFVNKKFGDQLTDSQLQIVIDEVIDRPDEDLVDVVNDVVANIADYEDDKAFIAEMRVAIANGEQKQFLEKHFGKY